LRIAVCVKPVPDPRTAKNVTIDPVTKTITRENSTSVINPLDRNAIELALYLKEKEGGEIVVFSMAPPSATVVLRETLALGADKAYLLSDRAFGGSDTLATANILSAGLKYASPDDGWDLILFGAYSTDGGTSQVPAQVGDLLCLPHFHFLTELNYSDGKYDISCDNGAGEDKWEASGPIVLSVTRKINKPRYTTIRGVMKAKSKEIIQLGKDDINPDPEFLGLKGSPTQYGEIYEIKVTRQSQKLSGSKEEILLKLLDKLTDSGVILRKGGQDCGC